MFEAERMEGTGLALMVEPAKQGKHTHWLAVEEMTIKAFPGRTLRRLVVFNERPQVDRRPGRVGEYNGWAAKGWKGSRINLYDELDMLMQCKDLAEVSKAWAARKIPAALKAMYTSGLTCIPVRVWAALPDAATDGTTAQQPPHNDEGADIGE